MRIGIDASNWTNWRGFGRFTRGIVQALLTIDRDNQYVLFFDQTYERCEGVPANARHIVTKTSAALSDVIVDGRRSTGDMARMTMAVAREQPDVFFCPSIDSYFPLITGGCRVVMIHDVIPETIGATMLPDPMSRWRRRLKVRTALAQAHVVATGSEYVRRQIGDVFGLATDALAVIPYGVADIFRPPTSRPCAEQQVEQHHGVHPRYLLHVGGFGPNKNIPALLESVARLTAESQFADVSLVFVGKRDDDARYEEAPQIERRLEQPDLKDRVKFLGFQSDAELVPLYQAAAALILPSLVEGFGLPAVEAVCCGTPAVVTRTSPLPEALGNAAVSVDPRNTAELTTAIQLVITDPSFTGRALARAGQFSWQASALAALAAFRQARKRALV